MTLPLVVLAVFSVCVAWGWPLWSPHASYLGHLLDRANPHVAGATVFENHSAGWLALAAAAAGVSVAVLMYGVRKIDPAQVKARAGELYAFLREKWYFDELYDAVFVRPAVALGYGTARFDKRAAPPEQAEVADRTVNVSSLDGVLNAVGLGTLSVGRRLRQVQSGLIRGYVTALLLAAVALCGLIVLVYVGL
jgi:NADH-quinone oxidoreductase subunit L